MPKSAARPLHRADYTPGAAVRNHVEAALCPELASALAAGALTSVDGETYAWNAAGQLARFPDGPLDARYSCGRSVEFVYVCAWAGGLQIKGLKARPKMLRDEAGVSSPSERRWRRM